MIAPDDAEGLGWLTTIVLDPAAGWDVVKVQVPAPRALAPWLRDEVRRPIPALRRWLEAVRDELRGRTAEPVDFRRDADVGCPCADCADVANFLQDPAAATFRLRAPEARRRHVEQQVRHRPIDLPASPSAGAAPTRSS